MALFMILIGLGLAAYKNLVLGFPLIPGVSQDVWTIESKITLKPIARESVEVSLVLPEPDAGWVSLDDHFASAGFNFSVIEADKHRRAKWSRESISRATTLFYKTQVYRTDDVQLKRGAIPKITLPELTKDRQEVMQKLVDALRAKAPRTEQFIPLLFEEINQSQRSQDLGFLVSSYAGNQLNVVTDILSFAGIPSQLIKGIFLEDGRRRQRIDSLIEVFDGDNWLIFDPRTGATGLPDNFFIWQQGSGSLLDVVGGRNSTLEFALVKNTLPLKSILFMEQHIGEQPLLDFSIYSLPIEQQGIFKGLLLIPVGALVIVLLRVLIGLRTSGTFMPVLIALAFIQTTLLAGLVIFITVVGFGLWIRYYLSYLNLLLVARISAVIIVVLLLMASLSVISYKLGFHQALTVTFFPTIILAWTIERMSILWEEEGPHEVLIQGGGSLFAAVLVYLLMSTAIVEHLTFNFPELMISLLGIILVLGKYTGYRLLELYRFRSLGRTE
ncbi:MAG: hypothetical protein ACJAZI_001120 [Cycloclasticus sp.]|jgi:hypothetical protein